MKKTVLKLVSSIKKIEVLCMLCLVLEIQTCSFDCWWRKNRSLLTEEDIHLRKLWKLNADKSRKLLQVGTAGVNVRMVLARPRPGLALHVFILHRKFTDNHNRWTYAQLQNLLVRTLRMIMMKVTYHHATRSRHWVPMH